MSFEEKVILIIKNNLEKKPNVSLDKRLIEDLEIDSFDKLMIINAIEDEFNISIDEEDFKDVETVLDIVNKLNKIQKHFGVEEV